jgi:rhamnosyl/mannosyltransferase
MKIMIITPYFYPKIGGLENYVLNVAIGLQKRDHEVIIVTSNEGGNVRVEEKIQKLRVVRLPRLIKLFNTPIHPAWYFQLRSLIKSEKPNIINAHSPVPGLSDLAFFARGNTKFIMTYHSGSMKKKESKIIDLLLGLYEKTILRNTIIKSDAVVAIYPEFVKAIICPKKRNLYNIFPGVNIDLFKPAKAIKNNNRTVIYVGRIEKSSGWKGIGTLLHAMKKVTEYDPEAKIRLIGTGDAVEKYKRLAKQLGIAKNVEFAGALRGSALVKAYQTARLLVLASETEAESFGMVLIEAMSCGIPVIATKMGGMPRVVELTGGGLLVEPSNSASLSEGIIKLFEDKNLYNQLAKNGRENVPRYYSWTKTVDEYINLYNIILSQS